MKTISPLDLEHISETLEKVHALIAREIDVMCKLDCLSEEQGKLVISYTQAITAMYKDYKAERLLLSQEMGKRSKAELLAIVKTEAK